VQHPIEQAPPWSLMALKPADGSMAIELANTKERNK
jgi:hypothetical protein